MTYITPDCRSQSIREQTPKVTTTQALFDEMLRRIQTGEWPVGKPIPAERTLITELNVSRIALREALGMLRSLGVLDTSHGRNSIVRQVGTELLDRIVPLILSLEPVSGFHQVFEMRLAIEVPAAAPAQRRTSEDLAKLEALAVEYALQDSVEIDHYPRTDLEFHLQIARAAQNPLFTAMLNVISRYVIAGQQQSWGSSRPIAWDRAKRAHFAICEAIRDRDANRARVEMEAHLRYTATLVPANR